MTPVDDAREALLLAWEHGHVADDGDAAAFVAIFEAAIRAEYEAKLAALREAAERAGYTFTVVAGEYRLSALAATPAEARYENCRICDLTYPAGTDHKCTDGWAATPAEDHARFKRVGWFDDHQSTPSKAATPAEDGERRT